jgi:hypothetical protein
MTELMNSKFDGKKIDYKELCYDIIRAREKLFKQEDKIIPYSKEDKYIMDYIDYLLDELGVAK